MFFNMYYCSICKHGYTTPYNLARHLRLLHVGNDVNVVESAPGAPGAHGAPGAPGVPGAPGAPNDIDIPYMILAWDMVLDFVLVP